MKKILLADDNHDFVEIMKKNLESKNYSVVTTTDARDIVHLAQKEEVDLVILDIIMPHLDGYQVCENLRQHEKTSEVPVILLTGKDLIPKGIEERCRTMGVEAFLLKPVDSQVLVSKMEELLAKK